LISKFHRTISANSFVLPFEISTNSNGICLGSKIISAQAEDFKVIGFLKICKIRI